jgi:undecaprenyl phosphate-alpha-L-ara4N flippase subunit ArnF
LGPPVNGKRPLAWYLNPYLQLFVSALLIAVAEVLMKQGAVAGARANETGLFGMSALSSGATWIGTLIYILSFISWLHVLRLMPLTEAYAWISLVHIFVPLAALIFLGETISLVRWAGIALVLTGTILVAASAAVAEEEL